MEHEENRNEDIAEWAVRIATSFYGVIPSASPFQSARSRVFRLDFGDALESKILKIARAGIEEDVLREQQIIPALLSRGFEAPTIEFTQENTDFNVPFTVMSFVPGGWIGDTQRMAPAIAQAAYEHLGHFMARLSVLDAQAIPGGRTAAAVHAQAERSWAEGKKRLREHPRYTVRLETLLEQGRDLQQDMSGFVHWDGPQVITDGVSTFTVIDWGGAGAGHRLTDLSVFLAGHGFWVSLQQRQGLPIYAEWRDSVLRGFLGGRALTEEMRLRLHILGMSRNLLDAMTMAKHKHPKADALLTFIETEDAAF